jgi:outer membrane protein assembly factor BamB
LVVSTLFASLLLAACLPLEHALRFLSLVAEAERTLHRPTVVPSHQDSDLVGPLWTVDRLYATSNFGNPEICATHSGVALSGSWGSSLHDGVLLLDAASGEPVWTESGLVSWHIACSPDAVFLGGNYSVWRRNSDTGRAEWHRGVRVPGDIIHLHLADGAVYIWTRPHDATTIFDAITGETLPLPPVNDGRQLLLVRGDAAYAGYGSLSFYYQGADQPQWRAVLSASIYETPTFTDSIIYARSGEHLGRVYALEGSSGEVLWSTDANIRSNLVVTSQALYVLTDRGELQSLDPVSGESTTLTIFQPGNLSTGLDTGGYYIALSDETSTLYVYLGLTYELMAFHLRSR